MLANYLRLSIHSKTAKPNRKTPAISATGLSPYLPLLVHHTMSEVTPKAARNRAISGKVVRMTSPVASNQRIPDRYYLNGRGKPHAAKSVASMLAG
jgi:hypothetical protein